METTTELKVGMASQWKAMVHAVEARGLCGIYLYIYIYVYTQGFGFRFVVSRNA